MADFQFEKQDRSPWGWKILYGPWPGSVFSGRSRTDWAFSAAFVRPPPAGAALGPDVFRFFHALGVNLKQIYGQTEISGISCIHLRRRHGRQYRGHAHTGDRAQNIDDPDTRGRGRNRLPQPGPFYRLLSRTTRPPRIPSATAGFIPETPVTWTKRGTWSASTVSRT